MKKKVGLISLFLAGASALVLTGCNSSEVEQNSSDIKKITQKISALEDRISTVDTTLSQAIQEEIAKINAAIAKADESNEAAIEEAVGVLRAEMALADAAAKQEVLETLDSTKDAIDAEIEKKASSAAVAEEVAELQGQIDDLKAENTAKTTKLTELEETLATKASSEDVTAIQAEITTIKADIAANTEKITALETGLADYATVEALNAAKARITTLEEEVQELDAGTVTDQELAAVVTELNGVKEDLTALTTRVSDLETAKTTIEGSIETINETITDHDTKISNLQTTVLSLTSTTTTMQQKITALEQAKTDFTNTIALMNQNLATKAALAENVAELEAADEAFDELIAQIKSELEAKDTEISDDIDAINETLEAQAQQITELIETVSQDATGVAKALEDFYGEEAQATKADYVYQLSQIYANFQENLDEVRLEMLEAFTIDNVLSDEDRAFVENIYRGLYNKSNHEMVGYLWKGVEYISLAADVESAGEAFNEYKAKLESFINEAEFTISKELARQSVEKLTYIPENTEEAILQAIEAITYNTDETLEMTAEEVQTYLAIRTTKLSLLNAKAQTIDDTYKAKATAKTAIDNLANITSSEKTSLKNLVDSYVTLTDYTAVGADIEAATTELAPTTFAVAKAQLNELNVTDSAEIALLVKQATGYDTARGYDKSKEFTAETLANIKNETVKVDNVDVNVVARINALIAGVAQYDDYIEAETLVGQDEITAKVNEDKAAMDLLVSQASAYNTARGYDVNREAVITALENITSDEKTSINTLIAAVPAYADYIDAEDLTTSQLVAAKLTADATAINVIVLQAQKYDTARGYEHGYEFTSETLANIKTETVKVGEEDVNVIARINDLLHAIPQYGDYIGSELTTETALNAKVNDNKAAVDLLVAQATSYNTARGYDVNREAVITALENITSDEKTAIKTLIAAVPEYANYINAEDLTTSQLVTAKLNADEAAIDVIVLQAQKYDTARGYEHGYEFTAETLANIKNETVKVGEEDVNVIARINDLLHAIPQYDDYIGSELTTETALNTKVNANKAAVDLLVAQANAYDEARGYDVANEGAITAFENITADEKTAINTLIAAVPAYENYINSADLTTTTLVTAKLNADEAAIDVLVLQAQKYDKARGYEHVNEFTAETLANIKNETVKVGEEDVNVIVRINDLLHAIPQYGDYIGSELTTETALNTKVNDNKAAVDLLVAQAVAYNTARGYDLTAEANINDNTGFGKYLTTDEKTAINALIAAVPAYENYINAEDLTTTTLVTAKLNADEADIHSLTLQASAYAYIRYTANLSKFTAETLANIKNETVKVGEDDVNVITHINALIDEIPQYNDFIGTEYTTQELLTPVINEKIAEIELLVAQANAYNEARGYDVANEAAITALENITADEKTAINTLIAAVPVYENYVAAEALTDATAINTKLNADKAAMDLLVAQANAYNEVRGYDVANEAVITALTNIATAEKKSINELIAAVPNYAEYITVLTTETAITAKKTADKAAIDDIVTKATYYNDVLIEVATEVASVTSTTRIPQAERTAINELFNAIPVYANYINDNTTTQVATQKTNDLAAVALIDYQFDKYLGILNEIDSRVETIVDTYEDTTERETIIALMQAITSWTNYTGKTTGQVDAQVETDIAKLNLIGTRIDTFNNIRDYITTSNATIDGYVPENGTFSSADKANFKGLYAAYGTEEVYDAAIADFTTAAEYANYETQVKAAIDLIAKTNAKTYSDIINQVAVNVATINAKLLLTDTLKKNFIARFSALATYSVHYDNTKELTTVGDFTTYKTNAYNAINDVVRIAEYERQLIEYENNKVNAILQKQTNGDITAAEANYLSSVISAIYEAKTNKNVTVPTDASDNLANAKNEMDNVVNAVTTFSNVDGAIATLNSNINRYITDAEKYIMDSYYESIYKIALTVWNNNIDTINAKGEEASYSYALPEDTSYEAFQTFVQALPQATTIINRLTILSTWYENEEDADDDGVYDGMLYQIIDEYNTLEQAELPTVKTTYVNNLETKYNEYLAYDGTDPDKPDYTALAKNLKLAYNTWKTTINNSTTIASVISSYNNGIYALDNAVLDTAKSFYLDKLETNCEALKTQYPALANDIDDAFDYWQGLINGQTTSAAVAAQYENACEALDNILPE